MRSLIGASLAVLLAGCATAPAVQPEPPIQERVSRLEAVTRRPARPAQLSFASYRIERDAYRVARDLAYAAEGHAWCHGDALVFEAIYDEQAEARIPEMLKQIDSGFGHLVSDNNITEPELGRARMRLYHLLCD